MAATLAELVDALQHAAPHHELRLLEAGGRETALTWRALHGRILQRAAWFEARGVAAGDRVVACATNDAPILVSFLALLHLGAVPLSVGARAVGQAPDVQLALVRRLLDRFGARWVFGQPELLAGNEERGVVPADVVLDVSAPLAEAAVGLPGVRRAKPQPDDLALVQFSSGSTARPKGIRLTHRNVLANLRLVVEAGARDATEALATWLPLSHDMGLVGTLLASLLVRPRQMVLMHPMRFLLRPVSWFHQLSVTRARVTAVPSFALDLCVERTDPTRLQACGVELSALELLLVGAETVRPAALRRFEAAFAPFGLRERVLRPVYGLAEATLIVTATRPGEDVVTRTIDGTEVVSVGRPLGDFELRIVDTGGRHAPDGEVGEIQVRGSCVTPGALDPTADADLFEDGWLRTGDLGALDGPGRLFVTGRRKDLLIVDGRNHYAHDVGAALEGLAGLKPGGAHAFTVRVEGRKRVVVLAVPVGAGNGGLDQAIRRRVLGRCGLAVDDVVFAPRLPRTSSGKVRRDACRALYLERVSS